MELEVIKGKPLCKEETKNLINIIERSPIVLNKNTTANSNKIKNEEWLVIAKQFNTAASTGPRTQQQLRLKWENLKKNARKRHKIIKFNLSKPFGEQDYIPPDELLDKVIDLLRRPPSSCTAQVDENKKFDITIDSDNYKSSPSSTPPQSPTPSSSPPPTLLNDPLTIHEPSFVNVPQPSFRGQVSCTSVGSCTTVSRTEKPEEGLQNPTAAPEKLVPDTPEIGKRKSNIPSDGGRTARNLALAEYFSAKKRCLDERREYMSLRDEKLKLENENLRLSNEKLKLENVKLKLQLEQLKNNFI